MQSQYLILPSKRFFIILRKFTHQNVNRSYVNNNVMWKLESDFYSVQKQFE